MTDALVGIDVGTSAVKGIAIDEQGNVLFPGFVADLNEQDATGAYARTIIKIADPERYGIRVADYFV